MSTTGSAPSRCGSSRNCSRALEEVERELRDGAEASALDQDRPLVEDLRPLHDLAIGGEHAGVREALFDELTVVDPRERRTADLDPVYIEAVECWPVPEGGGTPWQRPIRVRRV